MVNPPYAKNLLFYVFVGSRGGNNRIRIMDSLQISPKNTNQLANELNLNYRAIQHHIEVLEKNNLIAKVGDKYGTNYFPSNFFDVNIEIFNEMIFKSKKGEV